MFLLVPQGALVVVGNGMVGGGDPMRGGPWWQPLSPFLRIPLVRHQRSGLGFGAAPAALLGLIVVDYCSRSQGSH